MYWKGNLNTYLDITFVTKCLYYFFDYTFVVSINASKSSRTNTDAYSKASDAIQFQKSKLFSNVKFLESFS